MEFQLKIIDNMQQDNNDRLVDVWLEPTKCLFGCLAFCGFFLCNNIGIFFLLCYSSNFFEKYSKKLYRLVCFIVVVL
jgi:hypothetical protein